MKFSIATIVLAATQLAAANPIADEAATSNLEARGPYCQARGAVNGQCGEIFASGGCGGGRISQIAPDVSSSGPSTLPTSPSFLPLYTKRSPP